MSSPSESGHSTSANSNISEATKRGPSATTTQTQTQTPVPASTATATAATNTSSSSSSNTPPANAPKNVDISATKNRIITHMNKDHQLSLFDYVNYFMNREIVDPDDGGISSVEMVDIDNDLITLKYTYKGSPNPQIAQFPVNPKMNSLSDARNTLVQMAKRAASFRGYTVHRVTKFAPIGTTKYARRDILTIINVIIICVPQVRNFVLDFFFHYVLRYGIANDDYNRLDVLRTFPQIVADFICFHDDYPWFFASFYMASNIIRTLFDLAPKVFKYRVPQSQKKWWYLSGFFEGYGTAERFDTLIDQVEGKH